MDENPHILVVDDDRRLRELLQKFLSDSGFRVTTAESAMDARVKLASIQFDLLVLDLMMPGESGLELTSGLRRTNSVPILMLTAMAEQDDKIEGLERGADDYLTKPFEPRELVARIRSILRRAGDVQSATTEFRFGSHIYDSQRQRLRGPDGIVPLTGAEARLLDVLAQSPGKPVSRDALKDQNSITGTARAVDVQVTRLRRKIEPNPRTPRYLQTIRGQGYVLWPD
ncbi:MAG: response regulator transcription factor [Alphaproteobacteria bacterium]|jgi:two-component system, OmpR family, phosphate regulon response regulator OmpR|nr:response regulator transcription factor [Alphaproteobacteria bacterium]